MSDTPEPIDPHTLPAEPVACSLGTWTHSDVDAGGNVYLIATPTGATIAIRGHGDLSAANIEADIANPAPAPVPVPAEVTRPRFVIALRKVLGLEEAHVFAMISAIEDAEEQQDTRDWWEHTGVFRRDDARLNAMAARESVTTEQLDAVFIHAANNT